MAVDAPDQCHPKVSGVPLRVLETSRRIAKRVSSNKRQI